MNTITILPEAKEELRSAANFYENQSPQLGKDFLTEFKLAIQTITIAPSRWPKVRGKIRRYLIRTYPYGIIYSVESNEIVIIAVAHLKRKPNY